MQDAYPAINLPNKRQELIEAVVNTLGHEQPYSKKDIIAIQKALTDQMKIFYPDLSPNFYKGNDGQPLTKDTLV